MHSVEPTTRLIVHDMLRTTAVLEKAASDAGDDFLQYLYAMALLHLEERLGKRRAPEPFNGKNSSIERLAQMIMQG
jgi:hypothetical protein